MIRLTEAQRTYIQMNLPYKSVSEVARKLDTSYMNVYREAEKMGISRRPQIRFTEEQDEFIKANYGIMRAKELARKLGVDTIAIYNRVRRLGCTRK